MKTTEMFNSQSKCSGMFIRNVYIIKLFKLKGYTKTLKVTVLSFKLWSSVVGGMDLRQGGLWFCVLCKLKSQKTYKISDSFEILDVFSTTEMTFDITESEVPKKALQGHWVQMRIVTIPNFMLPK